MEGKEVRFGIVNSRSVGHGDDRHLERLPSTRCTIRTRRWAAWCRCGLIQLGEVVFGGVGSGLYGMLVFAIVAVFIAGLMVGRTPEYLGKKIEIFEMKMASLGVLVPVLVAPDRHGVGRRDGMPAAPGPLNPGPHGFSEILYGYSSTANNNGSAFAGLNANTPFYNVTRRAWPC